MRSDAVVVRPPLLDHDAGFLEGVEHLAVEEFVPQLRCEAFALPVLPRTARLAVGGLGADRRDPVLDGFGDELRAVVRTDMPWHATEAGAVVEPETRPLRLPGRDLEPFTPPDALILSLAKDRPASR